MPKHPTIPHRLHAPLKPERAALWKRWAQLILWLALIGVFMFGVGPWLENTSWIRPMTTFIEERQIDASALYYTEIEEFSDASVYMDNSMTYTPNRESKRPEAQH